MPDYMILYNYIILKYGYSWFITDGIYQNARSIGINPASVGGHLNMLKHKGLLTNMYLRRTSNGRVMKMWQVTCLPEEQLQKGGH